MDNGTTVISGYVSRTEVMMSEIFYLTKRNCLVYVRDKSAVFFSLLSMLIVLGLMVIFLGAMNSRDLVRILAEYGGERDSVMDEKNATYVIWLWTLAGILVVNAVTVTLTVLGTMVQDETRKRIMGFYVTPVKRIKLVFGYVLASWIVGTVMCLLTLAAGEVYFLIRGYEILSVSVNLKLLLMIMLNTFVFSALGYLLALFVHSESGWSGMLTVVGTLVGFVGGIYIPLAALSEKLQVVLKALPVLHGTAMMRKVCTQQAVAEIFEGLPAKVSDIFNEQMGITLFWGEDRIDIKQQVIFLLIYAIVATGIAVVINKRRKLRDR